MVYKIITAALLILSAILMFNGMVAWAVWVMLLIIALILQEIAEKPKNQS